MAEARTEQLNLIQKLAKIRAMTEAIKENKEGYKYTYIDYTEILAKVTAGMKKYGVSLIPSITPGTAKIEQSVVRDVKMSKTGTPVETVSTEMLFSADMVFTWVDDQNPADKIEVPWVLVGAQIDPSMAAGSSLSYMSRYFMLNFFQIASLSPDNDVDAYRSKQKAAEAAEEKEIAGSLIEQFDEKLKTYLADNPKKKEEVQKFISRYAKNANYFAIKEPNLAAKLMQDFTDTYLEVNK